MVLLCTDVHVYFPSFMAVSGLGMNLSKFELAIIIDLQRVDFLVVNLVSQVRLISYIHDLS